MLTDPGDVVLDIFAGSNTTGQVADELGRRWLAFDLSREYLAASTFRFAGGAGSGWDPDLGRMYQAVIDEEGLHLLGSRQGTFLNAAE